MQIDPDGMWYDTQERRTMSEAKVERQFYPVKDREPLWTYDDVAAYLAMSPSHMRRLVSKGLLPSIKIGGARRFDQADIQMWIAAHRENAERNEN